MKKFAKAIIAVLALVCLVGACFALVACDPDKEEGNDAPQYDGKLIVATNAAFPPFEMVDENGNYVGIDMDIAREIGKIINYEVEIKDMEFDSVITSIETGVANIGMAGLTVNAERLEQVDFCDPYFEASQVVIAKKGSAIAAATNEDALISALEGKKIGFQIGTVGEYYVRGDEGWGFPGIANAEPTSFQNGAAAVLALNNGQIDAIVIDKAPAQQFVANNSDLVALVDIPLTVEEYAFAVAKGDTKTKELVNHAMEILKLKGTFDEIVAKYYQG